LNNEKKNMKKFDSKVFFWDILHIVIHVEHTTREPYFLKNLCILYLMNLTKNCRIIPRQCRWWWFLWYLEEKFDSLVEWRKKWCRAAWSWTC